MKRTPLKRKTPLKAKGELKRQTPLKKVNRERKARRYERDFGDKAAWIREHNCVVCGRLPSVAAHVKSRGAGGTAKDLVPLCGGIDGHHEEQHNGIKTFETKYGLDLTALAEEFEARWQGHLDGLDDLGF